jgi:ABC-type microcin C transport system permease subunit YejE
MSIFSREDAMLRGFRTVAVFIIVMAFVGAVVGVLLGALADNYLLWVAVMAVLGSGMGLALGYGMLPES